MLTLVIALLLLALGNKDSGSCLAYLFAAAVALMVLIGFGPAPFVWGFDILVAIVVVAGTWFGGKEIIVRRTMARHLPGLSDGLARGDSRAVAAACEGLANDYECAMAADFRMRTIMRANGVSQQRSAVDGYRALYRAADDKAVKDLAVSGAATILLSGRAATDIRLAAGALVLRHASTTSCLPRHSADALAGLFSHTDPEIRALMCRIGGAARAFQGSLLGHVRRCDEKNANVRAAAMEGLRSAATVNEVPRMEEMLRGRWLAADTAQGLREAVALARSRPATA